jgi:hypothetical protein
MSFDSELTRDKANPSFFKHQRDLGRARFSREAGASPMARSLALAKDTCP